MKQTGILKIKGTNENGLVIEPITLSSIYFSQNGALKLTTKTDETGRFDFDLPFGKYRVEVNSGTGALLPLSLGNLFELKSGDVIDTFEKWAEIPTTDNDLNDLILKQFKELAESASASAIDSNKSALEAKKQVDSMQPKLDEKWNIQETVGNANGKVMREGAYGIGGKSEPLILNDYDFDLIPEITQTFTVAQEWKNSPLGSSVMTGTCSVIARKYSAGTQTRIDLYVNKEHWARERHSSVWGSWFKVYSENNTKTDKNGVIHAGTKTPINTLNTSDLTDHIQEGLNQPVTSSAVKGELDKKADKTELDKKWDVQKTLGRGDVLRDGAYGFGMGTNELINPWAYGMGTLFYNSDHVAGLPWGFGLRISHGSEAIKKSVSIHFSGDSARSLYLVTNYNGNGFVDTVLSSYNTTVDANGFIKTASPIIHIFSDHIEYNDQFETEPKLEKLGVGVYKITGTLGLAEGLYPGDWYVQLPEDRYGKPYFNVEYERLDGGVIIRVYERIELYVPSDYQIEDRNGNLVDVKEKVVINGPLIDIKEEWRCIDLRFKEEEKEIDLIE